MNINKIGVIGLGVMGGGIAQLFAEHERQVLVWDANGDAIQKGLSNIEKRLKKSAEKGNLPNEIVPEIMRLITAANGLDDFADVDLVIEAVFEQSEIKRSILLPLSQITSAKTIICTNTSSLSVTELAASCHSPERFLGLHFFNPPTKLALVEMVPTAETSLEVINQVSELLRQCGKTPVAVKDSPGFIVNRLLLLMINEAAKMVEQKVASVEDIDTAMRLGVLHPAGPLAVADLIGLDTCVAILKILRQGLDDKAYEPAESLLQLVKLGKLGRKSGEGFYSYQS